MWGPAVQRSSETIGAIAAALAKAQAELTNPEKSLVATIRGRDAREPERTFRYAPLASGLDIVRKCLGQHEIAAVQTTEIDREAGLIRLTTMLAHSSGEWMASDWPVCPIADVSTPRRMGAALTYARRYSLFTLVGIAGEDDLDAPDLAFGGPSGAPSTPASSAGPGSANGHAAPSAAARSNEAQPKSLLPASRLLLPPEASASSCDELLNGLAAAVSGEEMALWAQRAIPVKNTLQAEDCARVEQAFAQKLDRLAADERAEDAPARPVNPQNPDELAPDQPGRSIQTPAQPANGAVAEGVASPAAVSDPDCAALAF